MSVPVRLLLAIDSAAEADAVVGVLKEAQQALLPERVASQEQMCLMLEKASWDAVVADTDLPGFSIKAILPLFAQLSLDLPFLLLVSPEKEEEALAAMQAGAHDYVLKTDLRRLPLALGRELMVAANRRQLRQAQRLEALGVLAGGIAHDFNNILAAILGYAELLREDSAPDSLQHANLEQIVKASNRARELVHQILAFSRRVQSERKPLQLQPIIDEALQLLRATLPKAIQIRTRVDARCGPVLADAIQIHQILMNLATNAYHAMREQGGVLEVGLEEVLVNPAAVQLQPDFKEGIYVQLTVSDTGYGMAPRTLERIFDPDFTTKPIGEGTGMGLAVVQGIVKGYGGAITVRSQPGKGTLFHLFFPRCKESEAKAVPAATGMPRGQGNILFVDDEEQIVHSNRQLLERLGYHVTGMVSSLAALAAFRARPARFDLVITDLTMPKLTGVELLQELRQIRPDIPVILCTGFSENVMAETIKSLEINAFITKPVTSREMAQVLHKVLANKVQDSTS
jgi:signal transduction histidine kinase/CheY-like chemotaxis protein